MARPPKYDWTALYNEYIAGGYRTITAFAEVKGIHPFAVHREFRKLRNGNRNGNNGNGNGSRAFNVSDNNGSEKSVEGPGKTKPEDKTKQNPGAGQNKTKSTERRQCAAISHKTGQRCRQPAMPGSDFCRVHTDGWEGQCTARSKQTGQRCKKKAVPGKRVCKFHGANGGVPPGRGIQNNLKHGFFAKIFPDDEETKALVSDIIEKGPLDILWENIVIQYLTIARAQKIAWVKNRDDLTKVLVRERNRLTERTSDTEREWEIQQAWDKYNRFLLAQSRAMASLEKLISKYEELLQAGRGSEEHRLRLEKLKIEVEKIRGSEDDNSLGDLARAIEESRRRAGGVSSNGEV